MSVSFHNEERRADWNFGEVARKDLLKIVSFPNY